MAEPTSPSTNAYAMPFTLNVNYGDPRTDRITLTYLDVDGITKTVRLCHDDDADSVVGQGYTN